jgi:GT2 family glycosyltransferase
MQGACMMMRRTTLDEIGGLDERFFMYSEEVDWCWRIWKAGWAVYYLPQATVLHWGGQSTSRAPAKRRIMVYRSKLLFLEKHHGSRTAFLFKGTLLITSILKMAFWAPLLISPRARDRSRAVENIRSYGVLIAGLFKSGG